MSLTIKIQTVPRQSLVLLNSLKITNKINNRVDEANFTIKKQQNQTYRPQLNDEVVIENGTDVIFGGVIVKIEESAKAGEQVRYDVKCTDYSQYLRRKIVVERYEDTTLIDIIEDLVDNYTSDGFTTTGVTLVKNITSFSFNGLTVSECFDKLAKSLSAYWYVDYNKDIHFFAKDTEVAPFNLTDTSNNYIYDSLQIVEDITQLRNKVTVRGGTNPSDTDRTETTVCQDAGQDVYPLGYKFAELPIVKVNSVAQTVGAEYLSDDTLVEVQWSYQQKYIRFTDGNLPSVNDVIEIVGKIEIPVIVRIQDNNSSDQFGIFEYKIDDETISTNDEAISRALVELESYANELHEGSFSTYTAGLVAGQRLNINSDIRGKNIDVIIQAVTKRPIDHNGASIRYDIDFATVKTLGIIEYLQNSLINEQITEEAQETLLNFLTPDGETFAFSDDGEQAVTMTTAPYVYGDDAGNVGVFNFSTWS